VVLNSGGKNKNKKKRKIPKIVATFVYASSQGQRTHSARKYSNANNQLLAMSALEKLWQVMTYNIKWEIQEPGQ
jgi:hypothetical protein